MSNTTFTARNAEYTALPPQALLAGATGYATISQDGRSTRFALPNLTIDGNWVEITAGELEAWVTATGCSRTEAKLTVMLNAPRSGLDDELCWYQGTPAHAYKWGGAVRNCGGLLFANEAAF